MSKDVLYVLPEPYTDDTFKETFSKFITQGYEGIMLRNLNMPYEFGKRSKNLLKYKEFFTEEFEIIDIVDSEQEPGQPRFICKLDKDSNVTCRMKGSKEVNKQYLDNKDSYIGKYLTIQYQAKTETGSIQFPVGIEIRLGSIKNGKFEPDV